MMQVLTRQNGGGQIWVVFYTSRALIQEQANHSLAVTRHSGRIQRQVQRVLKSSVEPNIGGTDPFGAFELPQDMSTDLALHHCEYPFYFRSIHRSSNGVVGRLKENRAKHIVINVFQNTRMPPNPRQSWMKINLSDKTLLSVA